MTSLRFHIRFPEHKIKEPIIYQIGRNSGYYLVFIPFAFFLALGVVIGQVWLLAFLCFGVRQG